MSAGFLTYPAIFTLDIFGETRCREHKYQCFESCTTFKSWQTCLLTVQTVYSGFMVILRICYKSREAAAIMHITRHNGRSLSDWVVFISLWRNLISCDMVTWLYKLNSTKLNVTLNVLLSCHRWRKKEFYSAGFSGTHLFFSPLNGVS